MFLIRKALSCAAVRGALFLAALSASAPALAQTTKTIPVAKDSIIRGGSYANENYGQDMLLATRASDDATYDRRSVLTFDTENTIPAGATINSAKLVLTVYNGNAESRRLSAYVIPVSFDEDTVTWKVRKSSTYWIYAGGDVASGYPATATVYGTSGSTVTFDVTQAVQTVVKGSYGSRYSRFLVLDEGAASRDSYKTFHAGQSAATASRPRLVVTYGSSSTTTTTPDPAPAPSTTTGGVTLRVLEWNLHHGVGTDGRYDIDRIATWMAKMDPDVIIANEVEKYTSWGNEDQPARYEALLEQKTGRNWYRSFTQEFGSWSSNGKGHLILSTYPIDGTSHAEITPSSGLKGAGAVGEASITVNGRNISLIVSHLDPDSSTMRLTQAKETIAWALGFAENRIVAGDMNAWPDQSSIAEFRKTYNDSWAVAESKGTAYGFSGLTPSGATKKGRIDYIFYSKYASQLVLKSSQVYDTRNSNGVMPSDHRPVLSTFEVR